jgi:hypothetical protein
MWYLIQYRPKWVDEPKPHQQRKIEEFEADNDQEAFEKFKNKVEGGLGLGDQLYKRKKYLINRQKKLMVTAADFFIS